MLYNLSKAALLEQLFSDIPDTAVDGVSSKTALGQKTSGISSSRQSLAGLLSNDVYIFFMMVFILGILSLIFLLGYKIHASSVHRGNKSNRRIDLPADIPADADGPPPHVNEQEYV